MSGQGRRPVRVTIEGEAYTPPGADSVLMVVRQDGAKLCLTEGPGVTVEDVTPPRVWTDGDVVRIVPKHGPAYVAQREHGAWPTTAGGKLEDSHMEYAEKAYALRVQVLRYQAGGDR